MAKKREKRQKLLREKKTKLRNKIKTYSLLLILSISLITLLYYTNPEIPIDGILGANRLEQLTHTISYENILLRATLYKIIMENSTWARGAQVGVTLLVSNKTLDYGIYNWSQEKNIVFVKKNRTAILEADQRHTIYFIDSLTGATIPVALVDTKYKSSFDSLVEYPPFQLHFVFYPDKCRPRISIENSRETKILVKLYREENRETRYESFTCSPPSCEYIVDGCYTDVEIGFEATLLNLVKLRVLGDNYYLLLGQSNILILLPSLFFFLLVRSIAKYKRLIRET